MPQEDMPIFSEEFQKSPSASESSGSLENVQSISSISSISGSIAGNNNNNNNPPIIFNQRSVRPNERLFEEIPIVQPLLLPREPSLDELLVR